MGLGKRTVINSLAGILIIILIVSGYGIIEGYMQITAEDPALFFFKNNKPDYHIMVILDGDNSERMSSVQKGIEKGSTLYNIAYEFWTFTGANKETQILRQFDIALRSLVDGIIIQSLDSNAFNTMLEVATKQQIPVVTFETTTPESERVNFVALNRYQVGVEVGKLLQKSFAKEGITQGDIIMFDASGEAIQDQAVGTHSELSNNFTIRIVALDKEGAALFNAEEATNQLLEKYANVVAVVCNSKEESLGVIQTLKNQNLLSTVQVVAFGNDQTLVDYVERQIIAGSIVPDFETMGLNGIKSIHDYWSGDFVSSYQSIPFSILEAEAKDAP